MRTQAPPQKEVEPPPQFSAHVYCLVWSNGWMDQDGTWHGGGPRSRRHCAGWGPSCHHPHQKRDKPPNFWPTTGRRNKPTAMAIVPNISPGDSCKVRLDQLMTILLQTYKLVLLSLKVRFFWKSLNRSIFGEITSTGIQWYSLCEMGCRTLAQSINLTQNVCMSVRL